MMRKAPPAVEATTERLKAGLATLLAVRDAHPQTEGVDDWIRRFAGEIKTRAREADEIEEARRLIA